MKNPDTEFTLEDFLIKLGDEKTKGGVIITWEEIAQKIADTFGIIKDESSWRKQYKRISSSENHEHLENISSEENNLSLDEILNTIKKEQYKLCDQRSQINRDLRSISREELIKEIAHDAAITLKDHPYFLSFSSDMKVSKDNPEKDAILCISDWHYGIDIDNYYNHFNPQICCERISRLEIEVAKIIEKENLTHINVVNLGDMIAGLIHNSIRYQSRVDVITQILEVSQILREFLNDLSNLVTIDYYDTLDNHSRIDINKDETTKLAQLSRITGPFLKEALQNNSNIVIHPMNENPTESIIRFDLFNGKFKIAGVHGDKDKPGQAIDNIKGYSREQIDLLLSAHRHHFSADEKNFTLHICNGSLMGTDEFAENLRLSSSPSQNLIICTEDNVMHTLYRIILD